MSSASGRVPPGRWPGRRGVPRPGRAMQHCRLGLRQLSVHGPDYVQVDAQGTPGVVRGARGGVWAAACLLLGAPFCPTRLCCGTFSAPGCPEHLGDTLPDQQDDLRAPVCSLPLSFHRCGPKVGLPAPLDLPEGPTDASLLPYSPSQASSPLRPLPRIWSGLPSVCPPSGSLHLSAQMRFLVLGLFVEQSLCAMGGVWSY